MSRSRSTASSRNGYAASERQLLSELRRALRGLRDRLPRAPSGEPRARLRYLVALFAKDVTVVTTHAANEPVLDQMIDVLAHAERNLLRGPR